MVASHKNHGKLDQEMIGTKSISLSQTESLFSIMMTASEENSAEEGKRLSDEDITGKYYSRTHHSSNTMLVQEMLFYSCSPDMRWAVRDIGLYQS
jgi:hypothetical protein